MCVHIAELVEMPGVNRTFSVHAATVVSLVLSLQLCVQLSGSVMQILVVLCVVVKLILFRNAKAYATPN